MDALSQILAALSVKSYTATGVRGGGFSIAYPAYPGMKLLVPRTGKMFFLKNENPTPDFTENDSEHGTVGSSALSEAKSTFNWIELLPGSLLLMVEPTGFIFTDDPKLEPHPSAQTPYELRGGLADYGIKPGYEENILLAGKMTLDPTAAAQLRAALPPLLILKPNDNEADRLGWMMKMLHEEVESSEPGSSLVTTHLMQLVLIEVIRCWIHSPEAKNHPGIFLALRQPTLFRALSAIHNAPEKPWTVETLARAAGMSRSGFAKLFRESVGETPLAYLTQWRITAACQLLRDTNLSIKEAASRLGFSSPALFTAVFQRIMGMTPTQCREQQMRELTASFAAYAAYEAYEASGNIGQEAQVPTIGTNRKI